MSKAPGDAENPSKPRLPNRDWPGPNEGKDPPIKGEPKEELIEKLALKLLPIATVNCLQETSDEVICTSLAIWTPSPATGPFKLLQTLLLSCELDCRGVAKVPFPFRV